LEEAATDFIPLISVWHFIGKTVFLKKTKLTFSRNQL
jgi:hypothetical protein